MLKFFDRVEDKVRGWLLRHPFIYATYGGIGLVLFWRGVWHTTDFFAHYIYTGEAENTIDLFGLPIWDGVISFILGAGILLSCGLFISELMGKEIIISGLRGEKKLAQRTEGEVRTEAGALAEVLERLDAITARIEEIEAGHHQNKR
jgi:hypothetical protein